MSEPEVRITDFIGGANASMTSTTASTTGGHLTLVTSSGFYDPERHPYFLKARDRVEGYFFDEEYMVCRKCGAVISGISRKVEISGTGWDVDGYANIDSTTGELEWQPEYIEVEDTQVEKTLEWSSDDCRCTADELGELVVAYARCEAEDDVLSHNEDGSFAKSIKEGHLIVFDTTAWEEENERLAVEQRRAQRERDQAEVARLQARLAKADDDLPF